MAFQSSIENGFYINTTDITSATYANHGITGNGLDKANKVVQFGGSHNAAKLLDVARSIIQGGDISRDRDVEEDMPFGVQNPTQVDVGTFTAVGVTLGGFYNDTAILFPEVMRTWFRSSGRIKPRWFVKTFDDTGGNYTVTPDKFVAFLCIITSFKLMGETGKVQRFEAMIKSTGKIFENSVPTSQPHLF